MVLTKRDVLPVTLSDEKIKSYVSRRLKEENIQVEDILIAGYMTKGSEKAKKFSKRFPRRPTAWAKRKTLSSWDSPTPASPLWSTACSTAGN
ncbi:hypothetical protein [Allobaculum sp. Allo2]|uniref:hypothetical protein n=1 Tax=Allobaculum sp. Allo2 TaxID=2853432 RepID=UPI001F601CC7|nr:hypothetical protein [Allobaculum sp. Allo2]UNT93399.1 hypothetical protein KWG61_00745 [Allobaculum sp. Allo2]